jgi:hypothetical protein
MPYDDGSQHVTISIIARRDAFIAHWRAFLFVVAD